MQPGPFNQDYAASESAPDAGEFGEWVRVCTKWEVPRGGFKVVQAGQLELGVFFVGGRYAAYRNACPHAGAPICAGLITGTALPGGVHHFQWGRQGEILRCPWHGWEFDLCDGGRHLAHTGMKLKEYPLQIKSDGSIWVRVP